MLEKNPSNIWGQDKPNWKLGFEVNGKSSRVFFPDDFDRLAQKCDWFVVNKICEDKKNCGEILAGTVVFHFRLAMVVARRM